MAKLTLTDLGTTLSNTAANTININNDRVEAALENTLSRDGSTPNQMLADIDLNDNDLLNVKSVNTDELYINGELVVPGDVVNAENFATAAQGLLADSALQPGEAATPAQGLLADTAIQPEDYNNRASAINVLSSQFGVDLTDGTTIDRTEAIQAAIDDVTASGKAIFFPAATYNIENLAFPTGMVAYTAGIDRTIFRLADDAAELSNCWGPATRDGTTTDVTFIGGFTCDGNYSRATVTGETFDTGAPRPASSCFITGGVDGLVIVGGIKVIDGVLHGLDVGSGGETTELGVTNYVTADNLSPTYYPANMAKNIYIDLVIGDNCGDDAITGHYSHTVRIGKAVVLSAGNRHPDPQASNGPEVDDGCYDWSIEWAEAHDCNMGVSTKCHSGNPAPRDVHFGKIKVVGCARSFLADDPNTVPWANHNITVGDIIIEAPAQIQTDSPYQVYGAVFSGINNWSCGSINVVGAGSSLFNVAGTDYLRRAVQVDSGCRNWSIDSINVSNWGSGNITSADVAALTIASDVNPGHIGSLNAYDVGYRGAFINSVFDVSVGPMTFENPSLLTGSIAVIAGGISRTQRTELDIVSAINFESVATYGTLTIKNPIKTLSGNLRVGGFLGLDGATTKIISGDSITIGAGDGSFIRIDTEAAAATDTLSNIVGGNNGDFLLMCLVSNNRDITVDVGAGNIGGSADFTLTDTLQMVMMFKHADVWKIINKF